MERRARMPDKMIVSLWIKQKCFKSQLKSVYCLNVSQRVRQFIPGLRSRVRERPPSEVGNSHVYDEVAPSCKKQPCSQQQGTWDNRDMTRWHITALKLEMASYNRTALAIQGKGIEQQNKKTMKTHSPI